MFLCRCSILSNATVKCDTGVYQSLQAWKDHKLHIDHEVKLLCRGGGASLPCELRPPTRPKHFKTGLQEPVNSFGCILNALNSLTLSDFTLEAQRCPTLHCGACSVKYQDPKSNDSVCKSKKTGKMKQNLMSEVKHSVASNHSNYSSDYTVQ